MFFTELKAKPFWRLRNWFIWLVPLLLLFTLFKTDPDSNMATTLLWGLKLGTQFFIAVALAHLGMRFLHDYPEADTRSLFAAARPQDGKPGDTAASWALVAKALFFCALLMAASAAVHAQDVRTFIPAKCASNMSVLEAERARFWPDHPRPGMLEALAEHESCVSLKSARCCDASSQLKKAREEGASILQITRAYRVDGSLRFDALAELKAAHPVLADWSWENVYKRPDLANRALVLKMQDNFKFFMRIVDDPQVALAFADAGYNGGNGGVQSDRRLCGLTSGCNARKWFGNVELTCTKSKDALYGQRSPCDINRHHVSDVVFTRTPKYARALA